MSMRASFLRLFGTLLLGLVLALVELPDSVAALRPEFAAMALAYIAYLTRSGWALPTAWLYGLCMDVLFGAPLGQYAMAMTLLAFAVVKLAGLMRALALWQSALLMLPVWAIYAFLLFWMDGSTQHAADATLRWSPVLSTALAWMPLEFLARLRLQTLRAAAAH